MGVLLVDFLTHWILFLFCSWFMLFSFGRFFGFSGSLLVRFLPDSDLLMFLVLLVGCLGAWLQDISKLICCQFETLSWRRIKWKWFESARSKLIWCQK
ncbi:hypothetical protein BKA64DRAFT_664559 [Cadophora sp. MPI-SDFR-AT-0126]|nr:hypothetical protein BKA64DRAFT_664559 [Leotiomycetes sp. MPI-SDFR-AT-0126]